MIDLRDIDPAYWHPSKAYSIQEEEFFKEPTKLKHFKKRIELLEKRREEDTLVFLPKGDGIFFKALKLYVLNKIPTQNEELSDKVYEYIGKEFSKEERKIMVEKYANYMSEVYSSE